ncbi:SMC family ATPase [Candidatus Woesearchaeota archaeon]|nr:SMC family ATPase [Candidatus Woesearchaeota archaeon]
MPWGIAVLLKRIQLHNIRSYIDQHFDFPEGIVVLAGDIGAGKSSVLLAIEFSLFGLLRSELTGAGLLRHGARTGSVELDFELNNKKITIKRCLVREKNAVVQDAGHIVIDGILQQAMPVELKAAILDMLGYPKSLASKSRNLIYRYTVYTPQEEMKQILADNSEERVDTLRRVFGVDKYKRIADNTRILTHALKERKAAHAALSAGIQEAKDELETTTVQQAALTAALSSIEGQKAKTAAEADKARARVTIAAQAVESLHELKKSVAVAQQEQQGLLRARQRVDDEYAALSRQIATLQLAVGTHRQSAELRSEIGKLLEENRTAETGLNLLTRQIAEINAKQEQADIATQRVSSIVTCPQCMQPVAEHHKAAVRAEHAQKTAMLEQQKESLLAQRTQAEAKRQNMQVLLEELRAAERQATISEANISALAEKTQKHTQLQQEADIIQQQVQASSTRLEQFTVQLQSMSSAEAAHREAMLALDASIQAEKQAAIENARTQASLESINAQAQRLQKELAAKETAKAAHRRTSIIEEWLSTYFIGLMESMEKNVLSRVYYEFNSAFQHWFAMLVEESLTARLDDNFSPIVTQNGFDMDVAHLSGGERTAVALAYRLSLNRVINDVINTIQTKSLIILDEPTDGFSSAQLDRMREVLEQLGCKQVIIVSHEQKIEGLADRVIRIAKPAHVSSVALLP